MRIISDLEIARAFLQRPDLAAWEVPESFKDGIRRTFGTDLSAEGAVSRILADVKANGDQALLSYTRLIDGVELEDLEVSPESMAEASQAIDPSVLAAMNLAAQRIGAFHQKQLRQSWVTFEEGGLGQVLRPLERVGIYVPGGRAPYPSTVLMTAIPAKVAGVPQVILATPPQKDGSVNPLILAAARLAKVDRVFKIGGAQAIGAMAYGTASVPKVDKICGPGNIFVTLAKKAVYGAVDIDALQGPSEAVILADGSANPRYCAADLLAQAEHDEMASAIMITTSQALAEAVNLEIAKMLPGLERSEIITYALEKRGCVIIVNTIEDGIELVNEYAPEHLSLVVKDPWSYVGQIRHSGCIFMGEIAAPLGDYVAGPSHALPTGGAARFSSPLGVDHFLKATSLVALREDIAAALGSYGAVLARAEGLTAHAKSMEMRLRHQNGGHKG